MPRPSCLQGAIYVCYRTDYNPEARTLASMDLVFGRMDAATLGAGALIVIGGTQMSTQWVFTSAYLPHADEPIAFLLDDRDVPLHGTYANGVFRSHWAEYEVGRVKSWRAVEIDAVAPMLAFAAVASSNGLFAG